MITLNHYDSLIPANEDERIQKLYAYEILDTPAEHTFDKIVQLAAQLFNTPFAQLSFVDRERVFFKAAISPLAITEMDRKDSFCTWTIQRQHVLLIENVLDQPEFARHPFVTMENGIKFYAGTPLRTKEGWPIGVLCVMDTEPKKATAQQLAMFESLAAMVMDQLEHRLTLRKALRTHSDMMNKVIHDLKNPNTTISLSAELIKRKVDDPKIVSDFAERIKTATAHVLTRLNELLMLSQIENGSFKLNMAKLDLTHLLAAVKTNFGPIAQQKQQHIIINNNGNTTLLADATRLQDAFENLLSNALKFSSPQSTVTINVSTTDGALLTEIKDQGQGLSSEDMEKLFIKFARLSAKPTGREHSNGIGLSLVKMLIELHKGKVWATSQGKNKGSSFFVLLPID